MAHVSRELLENSMVEVEDLDDEGTLLGDRVGERLAHLLLHSLFTLAVAIPP